MALDTFSKFYFGYTITSANRNLNFSEGGGELTAILEIGAFTLTEILAVVKTAMDSAGALTYTVTTDRDSRKITIAATGTFELLLSTGSQIGTSPFSLLGFTSGVDLTGSASYEGSSESGSQYLPQVTLQDFVTSDDFQETIDANVNEAASGNLEIIGFGIRKFVLMSFKVITNLPMDGHFIKNNVTGLEDARAFFQVIVQKGPIEFMVDRDDTATFQKVILESTPTSSNGTGYRLVELTKNNVRDIFEINGLKFRVVE